ncbi:heterokaryon incompatibility protein-domain-containing protein [Cubamyces menziesii]|nr:heterokaryon incompatibility protein-domain-containing protein [Cubamyces menziesii]
MDLPPRPRSICSSAWEGVFAAQFGLLSGSLNRAWDSNTCRWVRTGGFEYSAGLPAMLQCAKKGCLWCRFLVDFFPSEFTRPSVLRRKWPLSRVDIRMGSSAELPSCLTIIVNECERSFDIWTTEDNPAANWIKGRLRIPHVGAPRVLSLAKACVEQCARDHERCRTITPPSPGSTSPPSRIIDCSNPFCLRIVETGSSTWSEPYIALSYVWGDDQPHRTTKDNLVSYTKHGIDYLTLPQTIRDAVRVTRALGARFLWVDSLCIIQDSQEDKHRELARMRDVYRHAYLTIDAASARSVNEGFLQDQRPLDPEHTLPFVCPCDSKSMHLSPETEEAIGEIYLTSRHYYHEAPMDLRTRADKPGELPQSYTARRAWCLQETLLSTRSLVFTSETMQLRCHSQTQNVGGASHDPEFDLPRLPDTVFQSQIAPDDSDEWRDIRKSWCTIVEDYSNRSLSYPSDKLIAFAGLAELYARTLCSDYLAGLWRSTLLLDLLWQRRPGASTLRCVRYRAPSWSWSCIDGPVTFFTYQVGNNTEALAEVVECSTPLQDESLPFGPVDAGSLIIRATCFQYRRRAGTDGYYRGVRQLAIAMDPSDVGREQLTTAASDDFEAKLESSIFHAPNELSVSIHFDCEDGDATLPELWIVPLAVFNEWQVIGIAVTQAGRDVWRRASARHGESATSGREVFRRVGFCGIQNPHPSVLKNYPRVEIELV